MPLTKKDISDIKGIIHNEVENLARIVASGFVAIDKRFEQVDHRFEQVDKRFEKIDSQLSHIDARLDTIEHDILDIKEYVVHRDEFEEVLARLAAIEKKIGIHKSPAKAS